ncbi:FUSC family protein, partial [Escherichia coli]
SKRPYAALLIGITLAVVSSAPAGDLQTALWRSTNIIIGCILAMLFTSIFPQRAFINWRIQLADFLSDYLKITTAGVSRNVLAPPRMAKLQTRALNNV